MYTLYVQVLYIKLTIHDISLLIDGYRAIAWNYEWEKGQKLHHADHIHIPSCTNDSKMIKQWKRITLTISDMESLRVLVRILSRHTLMT